MEAGRGRKNAEVGASVNERLRRTRHIRTLLTNGATDLTPDDFKRLAAAGLSTDQIALVMEMMERDAKAYADAEEARKSKGRERMAKWRLERHRNVTVQSPNVREPLTRAVEDKPLPKDIEPQDKKTSRTSDVDAFVAGLTPDVPGEILTDFVKVRRKKRGALTGYAAKLFREDAAACSMSVADAAKECVRSSWITVKPEYFASRQRAGPSPPPPLKDTPANAAKRRLEILQNERRNGSQTDDHQSVAGFIPGHAIRLVG